MKKTAPLKIRASDFLGYLAKITGIPVSHAADGMVRTYMEVLDNTEITIPCLFQDLYIIQTKLPVISDVFLPAKKKNLLLDIMSEIEQDRIAIVADSFITGPESLFLVTMTSKSVATLAKWMDFMKTPRIMLSEVDKDETDGNPTYLVLAPLKSFI